MDKKTEEIIAAIEHKRDELYSAAPVIVEPFWMAHYEYRATRRP